MNFENGCGGRIFEEQEWIPELNTVSAVKYLCHLNDKYFDYGTCIFSNLTEYDM